MRTFWIAFGVGAHALFGLTVCRLVPFLHGIGRGLLSDRLAGVPWFVADAFLAVQFAVFHSALLLPQSRQRLKSLIPAPQYGCFFCAVTCLSLLLTIELWQPTGAAIYRLTGTAGTAMNVAFALAWAALLYSLWLSGLGYQTGWTPWWAWLRGRPVQRGWPEPRGAYRWLRHPVYLSFLGLVWLTPSMTLDRALLTAVWTVYIFVGSWLKDRRLLHYVGEPYRRYQERVAGYPFIPFGPLGRVAAKTRRVA